MARLWDWLYKRSNSIIPGYLATTSTIRLDSRPWEPIIHDDVTVLQTSKPQHNQLIKMGIDQEIFIN